MLHQRSPTISLQGAGARGDGRRVGRGTRLGEARGGEEATGPRRGGRAGGRAASRLPDTFFTVQKSKASIRTQSTKMLTKLDENHEPNM